MRSERATAIIELPPDPSILPQGGVLMTGERWDLKGGLSYGLPGGGAEGESAARALERELWEELRVSIRAMILLERRLVAGRVHNIFGVEAEGEVELDEWELFGIQAFAAGHKINPLKNHVNPILLGPQGYLKVHRPALQSSLLSTRLSIPPHLFAPHQAPLHGFWNFDHR